MSKHVTRIVYEREDGARNGSLEISGSGKEVFDAVVRIFAGACQAYHFNAEKFAAALPELVFIEKHLVNSTMTDIGAIKRAMGGGDGAE